MQTASHTIDPDWMTRHRVTEAEVLLGAEHLRERLSSVPFYANRAKAWVAKGWIRTEMDYWRDLFGSQVNSARIFAAPSTPAPESPASQD